ncbi:hypothetical protein ARAM_004174 [Aspergillus rambellii]|uniref:AB hydrolase-1 domain-containing protein n=1 Tax=Aspergillus rambellii TaxID=308745 RepID=A0A0F8V157_9EURO|nr:hypothetical protein ARAM_004174 [Aspergillus rambellii]
MDGAENPSVTTAEAPFHAAPMLARRRKHDRSRPYSANPSTAVDPASPEVITSLISSLSTISVGLQSHFDNIPRIDSETDPSSLVFFPAEKLPVSDQQPPKEPGSGLTYAHNIEESSQHSFLHPDDAAVSPVVRMARPPQPPKTKTTVEPPNSPARPTSRSSYTSCKAAGEDSAFGMITAEPGPRVSTAASIHSTSSRKSIRSLLRKSSREFSSDKQTERLRKTNSFTDGQKHHIPRSRASLRSLHSMANVVEEGRPGQSKSELGTPTGKERPSLQSNRESAPSTPGGIGSGRVIPARESSLRHSHSAGTKHRKSARHSRYSSISSREAKADSGISGFGAEAEQVTKRIQELKDQQQKIKSELETDNTPYQPTRKPSNASVRPSYHTSDASSSVTRVDNGRQAALEDEESAPSPAILTGKSRSFPRNSPQVASKSNNPSSQPFGPRQSFEPADPLEKLRYRRSVEPTTPTKLHKRSPSGPGSNTRASGVGDERPSSSDSIDLAVLDYVSSHKLTQRVLHPTSGRVIAFSEVGDPKGHVVLCCLGMGLTRYLMAFYDELARSLGIRLVTLDRPGVGESGPYVNEIATPLSWPDDVAIVCNHLKVTKFSILAHSAGAIYALATALRIPQHIRGRIHLLAPWIPPSQLSNIGSPKNPVPNNAVPYSQRILRALPTSILKVANSSFMSATSASITSSLPKSPRRAKRRATMKDSARPIPVEGESNGSPQPEKTNVKSVDTPKPPPVPTGLNDRKGQVTTSQNTVDSQERERQMDYDNRLTHKIWELATTNANPAVDLLVCLERHQPIGFRYVDITRNVVIHHGSRDTRVPVDNVRWLGQTMRRCEVRVLEGEGHGLMASATVMGNVLMEIAQEWDDWMIVVQGKRRATIGTRSGIKAG